MVSVLVLMLGLVVAVAVVVVADSEFPEVRVTSRHNRRRFCLVTVAAIHRRIRNLLPAIDRPLVVDKCMSDRPPRSTRSSTLPTDNKYKRDFTVFFSGNRSVYVMYFVVRAEWRFVEQNQKKKITNEKGRLERRKICNMPKNDEVRL